MMAAECGHGAIVTYLVEQGANKDLQNKVSIHLRTTYDNHDNDCAHAFVMMNVFICMYVCVFERTHVFVCTSMYV